MSKKNKPDKSGIVFSTDPDFRFEHDEESGADTLPPQQQKFKVRLDTKHRGGKAVTLIEGFIGQDEDLRDLEKKLKNFCGTGGSSKDNQIIIQGDQREKIWLWLIKNGYGKSRKI